MYVIRKASLPVGAVSCVVVYTDLSEEVTAESSRLRKGTGSGPERAADVTVRRLPRRNIPGCVRRLRSWSWATGWGDLGGQRLVGQDVFRRGQTYSLLQPF